jgi:hypothetical protein
MKSLLLRGLFFSPAAFLTAVLPAFAQYSVNQSAVSSPHHRDVVAYVASSTHRQQDAISVWQKDAKTKHGCGKACGQCSGFYLGAEATFLAPIVDGAQFLVSPGDGAGGFPAGLNTFVHETDLEYMNVAPRLWLGYKSARGWGAQVRYWQMTNASDSVDAQFDPTIIVDRLSASTNSSLKMYTVDVEGTRDFCAGNWDMLATFGIRNGSFEQHDQIASLTFVDNVGLYDFYSQSGYASREFHGTGVTFSLAGSRPLGSHFSFFAGARGSTLWGENRAASSTSVIGSYLVAPLNANLEIDADRQVLVSDETLFIGEIQTGIRWQSDVRGFNARAFGEVAFEYQYWNASGRNASTTASALNAGLSNLASLSQTGDLDASLVGLSVGAGFVW